MNTTLRLRPLQFSESRTYLAAAIFVMANLVLPQLVHLVPHGGVTWLPIYFFTLVGACLYGWRVGMLTAVLSPVLNSLFFGMPASAALPAILLKSVLLAMIAGLAAWRRGRVSIALIAGIVLLYQTLGTLGEWAMKADFYAACQDFRIGIPGMLLQIFGGWFLLRFFTKDRQGAR